VIKIDLVNDWCRRGGSPTVRLAIADASTTADFGGAAAEANFVPLIGMHRCFMRESRHGGGGDMHDAMYE
jgi:hypothetical protein